MSQRAESFSRLRAVQREQTPQALARLVVITLFVGLWAVLWVARIPMPLPFLIALLLEIAFFLAYWRIASLLPSVRLVHAAQYVMLGGEIIFHTTMVYFLGALSWMGAFAYCFGLIFTNAFLDLRRGLIYTGLACSAFTALVLLEANGVVPHYVYLNQGPLRFSDPRFVTTSLVGAVGVFFSIYLWSSWVGHQLRRERDGAVQAQEELLDARVDLLRANEELEARVVIRTAELEAANAALSDSRQQMQLVLETCPDLISIQEPDGRFRFANAAHNAVLGYDPSELVAGATPGLIHPDDIELARERFVHMVTSGEPAEATLRFRHAKGHWVTLEANGRVLVNPAREATGVVIISRDVTERERAAEALRQSEATLKATIESTADGILVVDREGRIAYANTQFADIWGIPKEIFATLDRERILRLAIDQLKEPEAFVARIQELYGTDLEARDTLHLKDGRVIERYSRPLAQGSELSGRVWSFRDVTERRRAEEAIRQSEATLKATIESTADGILVVNHGGQVVYANERFAAMWRIPASLLETRNDDRLLEFVLSQLSDPAAFLAKVRELYQSAEESLDDLAFQDGRVFERYSRPLVMDGAISGRVWSFRDVTERKRAEDTLNEQARRDPLTGLLNRRAGIAAVEERLAAAKRDGRSMAILILDLDRFKLINDRYSHETGDSALRRFAEVMTELAGEHAIVCRLGGDEFEIALDGVALEGALRFALRLREALERSLKEPSSSLPPFTVSIGVACCPEDGDAHSELGRRADEAMYAAKAGGGDTVCVWRQLGNRQVA
jgi:diguanylate cyclase (GGDEF)-like protein/PAS domain S-box-containing protein